MKLFLLVIAAATTTSTPQRSPVWHCEFTKKQFCSVDGVCKPVQPTLSTEIIPIYADNYRRCQGNRCMEYKATIRRDGNDVVASIPDTGGFLRVSPSMQATEVIPQGTSVYISNGSCADAPIPTPLVKPQG